MDEIRVDEDTNVSEMGIFASSESIATKDPELAPLVN